MEKQELAKFNDMTREFIEDFIKKLPKEERQELKQYIKNNPRTTSSSMFTMVKSYIYRKYFQQEPSKPRKLNSFADTIFDLLDEEDEDNDITET